MTCVDIQLTANKELLSNGRASVNVARYRAAARYAPGRSRSFHDGTSIKEGIARAINST
jgi:hypothetical protein